MLILHLCLDNIIPRHSKNITIKDIYFDMHMMTFLLQCFHFHCTKLFYHFYKGSSECKYMKLQIHVHACVYMGPAPLQFWTGWRGLIQILTINCSKDLHGASPNTRVLESGPWWYKFKISPFFIQNERSLFLFIYQYHSSMQIFIQL